MCPLASPGVGHPASQVSHAGLGRCRKRSLSFWAFSAAAASAPRTGGGKLSTSPVSLAAAHEQSSRSTLMSFGGAPSCRELLVETCRSSSCLAMGAHSLAAARGGTRESTLVDERKQDDLWQSQAGRPLGRLELLARGAYRATISRRGARRCP